MSLTVGSQQQVTTLLHQFYYAALLARGKALHVLPSDRFQPELRDGSAFTEKIPRSLRSLGMT
jgi:hypothetical protein